MRITLPIILVILIGGGIYWYTQSDTGSPDDSVTNTTETTSAQSIDDLIALGSAQECVFTIDDPGGFQSWTLYTDGTRVRGDYDVATDDDTPWSGSIITDTEYHYNWGNYQGQTTGTKLSLDARDSVSNTNNGATTQDVDRSQAIQMNCSAWSVDDSMFTPPTDVTFTDLSETIQQNSEAVQSAACAACDAMADETAQQECRTALSCE